VFNLSLWEWLSGPSVAMTVIIILVVWTTSGTFMLLFIAALQNIGEEIDEASELDGASPWQRFRYVTLPMLRPTMLLVLTLGLIGTWQVFDQIYLTGNNPATVTPLTVRALIPNPIQTNAWQRLFGYGGSDSVPFGRWLTNSVIVATTITVGRVFLDSLAGYALARLRFRGRKLVFAMILATLAVPNVVLLIPRFLVLKELTLYNSYAGMILPIMVDAAGIFIMRQFSTSAGRAGRGRPHRWRRYRQDLLGRGAAPGPARVDHPYHLELPGLLE